MDIEEQLERNVRIDIPLALHALCPGAQWILRKEVWSGLEWLDKEQDQPAEQDVLDEIERLKLIKQQLQYRSDRRKEYPTWDEIHHAQLDGGMDEINARRQAVKEKYPKPV